MPHAHLSAAERSGADWSFGPTAVKGSHYSRKRLFRAATIVGNGTTATTMRPIIGSNPSLL
jgi:hypothetical protein